MMSLYKFLMEDELPTDELLAKQVIRRLSKYALIYCWLYKRSSTQLWLRYITEDDGQCILKDIHEGDCRSHEGAQMIAWKAFKKGYYWPTIMQDAKKLVQKCQVHVSIPRTPSEMLDILGPFPKAIRSKKFVIMAVDHFSKWAKTEAVQSITTQLEISFISKNIFTHLESLRNSSLIIGLSLRVSSLKTSAGNENLT